MANIDTLQKKIISCEERFEGTALVCQERSISFSEFDTMTKHVADFLYEKEIGPQKVVAVSMHRSEDMIIALYGVMKAGAAVLPIPLNAPHKRKQLIFEDIFVDYMITDEEYQIIMSREVKNHIPILADPDDDALILYTSGSTGTPKGVRHSQSSKLFSTDQYPLQIDQAGIRCSGIQTIIAKTNVDFISAYMFELLVAPLHGLKLVILTEEEQNLSGTVGKAIASYEHASIFMTPSQTVSFLKEPEFCSCFLNLQNLILGGELIKADAREIILQCADTKTHIVNVYGSSEFHIMAAGDVRRETFPFGTIVPEVDLKCVTGDFSPCRPGEAGQIVIASPFALSGYTNTETRCILLEGKKYYATGDEGCISEDGMVWVKGRLDRMVKYHGLRIELADIESNFCRYPGISSCAVVLNKTESGSEVLCAYYVSEEKPDSGTVRKFLADYLPAAMIPVGMIGLDQLPLNANGKIDYYSLTSRIYVPEKNVSGPASHRYTENEGLLCEILSDLLDIPEIDADLNVFQLGMDSLMAFRLIGNLKDRNYEITVEEIFSHPVISEMAGFLKKAEEEETDHPASEGPYAATGIQIYWGTDITPEKKQRGLYVTNTFICEIPYTEESLSDRVNLMIRKHPALRTHIVFENGMPGQIIADDACKIVNYIDLRDDGDKNGSPFSLSTVQQDYIQSQRTQMMKQIVTSEEVAALAVSCYRISDKACCIELTGNHLSVDGTSMNILMKEFSEKIPEEQEDHYPDYLRYIGQKSSIGKAIAFWSGYLKGAEFSGLPANEENKTDSAAPEFHSVTISLSQSETAAFEEKSRKTGISPVGHVMYCYGNALMKVLEKEALIMQILTFGRGVPVRGLDQAVGCFIQQIPIVIRKEDSPKKFQSGYLMAEQYSYLLPPILWKTSLGLDQPPKLAPFLISEIFPPVKTSGYFKEIADRDYEAMMMSNFIVKKDNCISLYFHYNATEVEAETFLKITDEIRQMLITV